MRGPGGWRWLLAGLVAVHAAIHLLGTLEGFGLADVPELTAPGGAAAGVLWLVAALAMAATAVAAIARPDRWWWIALPALVVSQVAIIGSWADAWAGTVVNVLVAVVALHDAARDGPRGLRARYHRAVAARLPDEDADRLLTEDDLAPLPPPLQRYLRRSGAVGQPVVRHVRACWRGRIRSSADDPWMVFTAVQHNVVDGPARFFLMDARRAGLPVDVLHAYTDGTATMDVRLLSLVPLVHAAGPEMDRAETVTVFNDLCLLAPGALVGPGLRWEAIDERSVRGWYTVGSTTVAATLHFNERDELVDFVSDDRLAMSGGDFIPMRWSTPVDGYHRLRNQTVASRSEARWHPADAPAFTYLEGELLDVEVNPSPATADAPGTSSRTGVPSPA